VHYATSVGIPAGGDFAAHRRFMERRRVVAFGDVDGRAALWCGSLAFIAAVVVVPLMVELK
jgi:hypothetical protein